MEEMELFETENMEVETETNEGIYEVVDFVGDVASEDKKVNGYLVGGLAVAGLTAIGAFVYKKFKNKKSDGETETKKKTKKVLKMVEVDEDGNIVFEDKNKTE